MTSLACAIGRLQLKIFSVFVRRTGVPAASPADARVLVVAPHSSFIDGFCLLHHEQVQPCPSPISAAENLDTPVLGHLFRVSRPVTVDREETRSRNRVLEKIKKRAEDYTQPQLAVFPEGTNSNRKALITFKPGAFVAGCPVQPILMRFKGWDTYTWTFSQNPSNLIYLYLLTMCQFWVSVEMEYMDVYTPNEEEKRDPMLFAKNVRKVMADRLGVPSCDWTRELGFLFEVLVELDMPIELLTFDYYEMYKETGLGWRDMSRIMMEFKQLQSNSSDCSVSRESLIDYVGNADIDIDDDHLSYADVLMLVGKQLRLMPHINARTTELLLKETCAKHHHME